MDHRSDCRLLEVSCRLRAIQLAARTNWGASDKLLADVALLAGWAGMHLGVVLEVGCDCSRPSAVAA